MVEEKGAAPKSGSGAERRRWPRANCELPITISLHGATHEAKLRDVSRAGVCFYMEHPIAPMTVLQLALELPDAGGARRTKTLRGRGAVVRCARISPTLSHWEIAVFLHDMSESDRALLEQQVKSTATAS